MTYVSRALRNVTRMVEGAEPWRRYQNDLWHWFKHAQPLHTSGHRRGAEMPGIQTEEEYVALAAQICRAAANEAAGTEVKIRTRASEAGDLLVHHYLVWYDPPGSHMPPLFLVVKDCGSHGALVTMFPPEEGRQYFERQQAEAIQ